MLFSPKRLQRSRAHLHHVSQLVDRIRTVVPEMGHRARTARRSRILIGQVHQAACERVAQRAIECLRFVSAGSEVLIAVSDRDFVPLADAFRVSVRQIGNAVRAEFRARRGIVHHRRATHRTRGVVVLQTERVAHLVRRQLAQTRQHHLQEFRRGGVGFVVRREQSFGDQEVLTIAQRAERNASLNDFAGARIDERVAVGPAARRSMHPLDDVVTHVHRIDFGRHDLDAKRILVTNRFERLVPPARAFEQRRTHRLGRAAIDVINDRLHGLAHARARIFLLQTMTRDEALGDRLLDRRREVHVVDAEITGARIEHSWLETRPAAVARTNDAREP